MIATLPDVKGLRDQPTEVRLHLAEIAEARGWSADGMAAAIAHESGWNPRAYNPGSGSSGLIQWTPQTARGFGTTTEAIRNMPAIEQLDLAERYWVRASGGREIGPDDWLVLGLGTGNVPGGYRSTLGDWVVLYPAGSPGARGNPTMLDPDGSLTVGGARRSLRRVLDGAGRLPVVALPAGSTRVVAAAAGFEVLFWLGLGVAFLLRAGRSRRPARAATQGRR